MRITLLCTGKTDVQWVKDGLDMYSKRISRYTSFNIVEIPQLKNAGALTGAQVKEKEGSLILSRLKGGEELILLDERGREPRSIELAERLRSHMVNSGKDIVFAVGGAYGFSDEVYARSSGMLSLSKLTFPHQMVRVIFAEQLYRAFTIINSEPYHHEG